MSHTSYYKKRAYHSLCLADGTLVNGPVVCCFDADGTLAEWHLLLGEEAFTEWVGGCLDVKNMIKNAS